MLRLILLILVFLAICNFCASQMKLVGCDQMLRDAFTAISKEQYDTALVRFRSVKICDSKYEKTVDSAIDAIYLHIRE